MRAHFPLGTFGGVARWLIGNPDRAPLKKYWEDSTLTERGKASVATGRLLRPQDEYKMTV